MFERLKFFFRYRELLRNLVIRDLKVRYRNSALGFLWAWGYPVLMMMVFTTVFSVLKRTSVPRFPLFIMVAWLAWGFTNGAVLEGLGSIVHNSNLIKKVYFPHEVLPFSSVLGNAVNFLLALPLVAALILFYHVPVQPALFLYFPIILIAQIALATGLTLLLSGINVFFRDTHVVTGAFMTAWFFLTPVFYPVKDLTGWWNGIDLGRLAYILNPMASIIESYRNIFYGSVEGGPPAQPDGDFLMRTVLTSFAFLIVGYLVFIRLSKRFGEEV